MIPVSRHTTDLVGPACRSTNPGHTIHTYDQS